MDRARLARRVIASAFIGLGADYVAEQPVRADLIYFQKGGNAQIPAASDGNRTIVSMPDGKVELPRAIFREIVPGFWPADEWNARTVQARPGGFDARFAAVWWAIENGLTIEVADELRKLHRLDPKHDVLARMAAVLDRLDGACDDADYAGLQRALGIEVKLARGPHVILLHQHPDADANERIALLERVITGFHLLFAAQGVELAVPRKRLVSAWFADRKDFLEFLHAENADAFATTRGYFHPTWNAVVAYDARSTTEQQSARTKLGARREELVVFSQQVDQAPARSRIRVKLGGEPSRTVGRSEARSMIARVHGEIVGETLLLDLDWRAIDLGTAAHEMIHQLVVDSGLVSRHGMFPIWLHEGLAAQFEVIRGGRWAGISRAHDLRLPDWRKLQSPLALERLVRDAGFGHGYQRDLYAQAWALVYFLRTQHPKEFLTFIDLLRSPSEFDSEADSKSDSRVFRAFERAFGKDLDRIETEWRGFMKTVQTPLEQHLPAHSMPAKAVSTPTTSKK